MIGPVHVLTHAATAAGHASAMVIWAWLFELVTLAMTRWRVLALAVRVLLRALYRRRCQLAPVPARRTGPNSDGMGWQPCPALLVPDESRPRAPPTRPRMGSVAAAAFPPRDRPGGKVPRSSVRSRHHVPPRPPRHRTGTYRTAQPSRRRDHLMNQQPPQQPYQQGHPQHWQQPPPPKKKRRTGLIIGSVIGGCLVLFAGCTAILAALAPDETTRLVEGAAATSTVPAATVPAPAATATPTTTRPKAATIGEGTWKVGSEVKPGTYTATVPDDSANCYYARLRDFENGLDSIIANNNYSPGQRARVTIKSSDVGFETSGCGTWT